jgi:hypothetical protein
VRVNLYKQVEKTHVREEKLQTHHTTRRQEKNDYVTFLLLALTMPLRLGNATWPFNTCDEGLSPLSMSFLHSSPILARFAGNILYCKLYRFRRWIGGTNWPDTRHSMTLGEK